MSKERELLRKILKANDEGYLSFLGFASLKNEIQELLAQPEQTEQEPVAWIIQTEVEGKLLEWVCTDKKHYIEAHDSIKEPIPLYTAPPKREPLSDEQYMKLYIDTYDSVNPITDFVRAIEKAHGIGGGK
jgi:hypothetical protein